MSRPQKNICVYCSSSSAVDTEFFRITGELGIAMAHRNHALVYGGGNPGLMGAIGESVHEAGGHVVGVIPEYFVQNGLAYTDCDELIVTQTMRERKATMEARADAFLALPGGFGTLEELFEILTNKQLGFHAKPIVILNAQGFYGPLINLFEHVYASRFAKPETRDLYLVTPDVQAALDYIENYNPPSIPRKWFG